MTESSPVCMPGVQSDLPAYISRLGSVHRTWLRPKAQTPDTLQWLGPEMTEESVKMIPFCQACLLSPRIKASSVPTELIIGPEGQSDADGMTSPL